PISDACDTRGRDHSGAGRAAAAGAGRGHRGRIEPRGRHSPGRTLRPLCHGDLRAENLPELPWGLKPWPLALVLALSPVFPCRLP
ncbi:hypothetical protein IHE44_0012803, partial [Lamprotornis superbus]